MVSTFVEEDQVTPNTSSEGRCRFSLASATPTSERPSFGAAKLHLQKTVLLEMEEGKKSKDKLKGETNHWLVDHYIFKAIITVLVLVNSVQMGFEVDHPELKHVWVVFDHVFAGSFFLEMCAKLMAIRLDYFKDRWNWLDGIISIMGFIDTWLVTMIGADDIGLSQFSIFRTLRLLRLVRFLKLMRQFGKLVVVMKSIGDAMETAMWVAFILIICIYVCAIFCVEFMGRDNGTYPAYSTEMPVIDESETMANFNPYIVFGDMPTAMISLFNIAILAEWTEIVRPVWVKQPPMIAFFVLFMGIVCFGVMNVIIGMIVDTVMQNARALEHEVEQTRTKEKVAIIEQLENIVCDVGSKGDVDPVRLHELLASNDPRIKGLMEKVHLPYGCTAKELLALLDTNGNGSIEHTEFLQSFYRLIYSGTFEQTCLIQMSVNKLTRAMLTLDGAFKHIDAQLTEHGSQLKELRKESICRTRCQDNVHAPASCARTTPSQTIVKTSIPSSSTERQDLGACLDSICQDVTKSIYSKMHEELTQCFERVLGMGLEAASGGKAAFVGQWDVIEEQVATLSTPAAAWQRPPPLSSPSPSPPPSTDATVLEALQSSPLAHPFNAPQREMNAVQGKSGKDAEDQASQKRPPEDVPECPQPVLPPPPPPFPPPNIRSDGDNRQTTGLLDSREI